MSFLNILRWYQSNGLKTKVIILLLSLSCLSWMDVKCLKIGRYEKV
jgi:hypothetical protein